MPKYVVQMQFIQEADNAEDAAWDAATGMVNGYYPIAKVIDVDTGEMCDVDMNEFRQFSMIGDK